MKPSLIVLLCCFWAVPALALPKNAEKNVSQKSADTVSAYDNEGNNNIYLSEALTADLQDIQKELKTLQSSQDTIQGRLNDLDEQIFSKINKLNRTITRFQQKLDDHDKSLPRLTTQISSLEKDLNTEITKYQQRLKDSENRIARLNSDIGQTKETLQQAKDRLSQRIISNAQLADKKISSVNNDISKNYRVWIFATVAVFLFALLLYLLLRKKINTEKAELAVRIQETRKHIDEKQVNLDTELTGLLEKQLSAIEAANQSSQQNQQPLSQEEDHSLALKVADELVRMQKNLNNMDPAIKGLKQLKAAVRRIQDNFEAKGYELVELIGKPYHEDMKVSPTFVSNEDLKPGEQIITRIIKPTVNYNGVMIQAGQIEVSINE